MATSSSTSSTPLPKATTSSTPSLPSSSTTNGQFTIRKPNNNSNNSRPGQLNPTPNQPLPPTTTTTGTPSITNAPSLFPALHLTPLNNTFVPKQISLDPPGVKVKIGRQTNAKTVPNGTNGYFDSKVLSRAHAEVWSEDGKVLIKDVKSSNGTFINGERLSPESAESDVFELHTDDVVEFGIDILTDDTKTIVHHKVAAKVHLVLNSDDAIASSREFNNWYRQADQNLVQHQQQQQQQGIVGGGGIGSQPLVGGGQPGGAMGGGQGGGVGGGQVGGRRPARAPVNAQNGLSFEHVLSRLQGELQKSRDTGSNLNDVNSTLCDVHDTLGGSVPRSSSSSASTTGPLPYPTTSSFPPRPPPGPTNESIQSLQQQLNDLASHVAKIRDLEGMLKEQEGVREEVERLKERLEGNKEESLLSSERSKEEGEEKGGKDEEGGNGERLSGRESPIARLLEREEKEEEDDDDDARSIASVDTIVEAPTVAKNKTTKQINGDVDSSSSSQGRPLDSEETTSEPISTSSLATTAHDDLAERERQALQDQNAALTARLDALSAELDEAIKLGRSLQQQHSEAFSTIKVLELKIHALESSVVEKVQEAQGKVVRECEERWKGWKEVFEEGWRREKEGWREEREKLWKVVREWEERRKEEEEGEEREDAESEEESDDRDESVAVPSSTSTSTSPTRSTSPKKRSTRRRKRTTIVPNVSNVASSPSSSSTAPSGSTSTSLPRNLSTLVSEGLAASDSDSTIGEGTRSAASGKGDSSNSSPSSGLRESHGSNRSVSSPHGLPVSWAGAVVVIAVAVGYGAALKLKE